MADKYSGVKPKLSFGKEEKGTDGMNLLALSRHVLADDDRIYICMQLHRTPRVSKANSGTFEQDISAVGNEEGEFHSAEGMSFYGSDKIVIADDKKNAIKFYKKSDLSFIKSFKGDLMAPKCIAVDDDNNIYVGENEKKRLRCFDANLKEKFIITKAGEKDLEGVNYVTYDNNNKRLIITDGDNNAVHVFNSNGEFLFTLAEVGEDPGQFLFPTGTAVDKNSNIFICDMQNRRVQVFDKDGQFLYYLGERNQFHYPMDVFIKPNGDVVVLDDNPGNAWSRVQVF